MSRNSFDNETLQKIGARIRKIRGQMTQNDFGAIIGVGRVAVANYEAGRRLPNREILGKIAKAGNVSPNWIISGDGHDQDREEIISRTRKHMALYDEFGALPKACLSDDERALLNLIRNLDPNIQMDVFSFVVKQYQTNPPVLEPIELNENLARVEKIIKKGRFTNGIDYQDFVNELEKVIKHELDGYYADIDEDICSDK